MIAVNAWQQPSLFFGLQWPRPLDVGSGEELFYMYVICARYRSWNT